MNDQDEAFAANAITLDAHAHVSRTGWLRLEYTVHNRSTVEIGVFNRMDGRLPNGDPDPVLRRGYVDFEDGRLIVRAMDLPGPGDGIRPAIHTPPYVSRIPAGGTLTDTVVLKAPVVVDDPNRRVRLLFAHRGMTVGPTEPREARSVKLIVGLFAVTPELPLFPVDSGRPDLFEIRGAPPRQLTRECGVPLPAPVGVLNLAASPQPS